MNGVLIDYPELAALAAAACNYGPLRTEARQILADLQAERALADDAAVMFTNLDNDDAVAMSDIEQWLARYREARQR
jgi:hypothetical protein